MIQLDKGRPGRGVWVLAALALLLLPWPRARAESKVDPKDKEDLERTSKVAAGAAGAINPIAGAVVVKVFEIGTFVVFFGQDFKEAEAITRIKARLIASASLKS